MSRSESVNSALFLPQFRDELRSNSSRVTATEMIDGVRCLLVLEKDVYGRYQELSIQPLRAEPQIEESAGATPWHEQLSARFPVARSHEIERGMS